MKKTFNFQAARTTALGATVLSTLALSASAQFVSYNDCAYRADQYTYTPYITTYTVPNGSGLPTSGLLKNTGNAGTILGVTATFTASNDVTLQTDKGSGLGGTDCAAGTDAANIFGGEVDLTGVQVYGSTGWYVDLTLSGLNPAMQYEFVTTANRNGTFSPARLTQFTLSGTDAFVNESSLGTAFSGVSDASTILNTGGNTTAGYVARWTEIRPGEDGTIEIRAEAGSANNSAYGFSAFRLTEMVVPEPSSLSVLALGSLFLLRRKS